jgi:hypothetical protein
MYPENHSLAPEKWIGIFTKDYRGRSYFISAKPNVQ